MALITLPYTFTNGPGNLIDATQVNADFTAITDQVNGALDNDNISATAAIAISKINFASGGTSFNKGTTGTNTWASGLTTDTQPQQTMTSDAGLQFGPGSTTAPDVRLNRSAANTLQLAKNDGTTGATLDLHSGLLTAAASLGLLNTFTATITPAAMAANRAILLPDPGGSAKLFCGDAALANHQLVKFDGNIFQGLSPGTAGKGIRSNGTDWIAVAPFQSSDQTITAAGTLTLAHGLGYTPLDVWYALVCQVGEANYTAGQVVYVGGVTTGTANQGFSAIVDGTNLTIRFGSAATTFSLPDATSGAATALTNADWKIRIFAA